MSSSDQAYLDRVVVAAARAIKQRRPALPVVAAPVERVKSVGDLLSLPQAARLVRVKPVFVREACRQGDLPYRLGPQQQRLVTRADAESWVARHRQAVGSVALRAQAQARTAQALRAEGLDQQEIAQRMHVSRGSVGRYLATAVT